MAELTILIAFFAGLVSFLSPCVLPLLPAYLTFLAGTSLKEPGQNQEGARFRIFFSSVFFVLGFSLVFSLIGVLLQGILANIAYDRRNWLGYIGGSVIIFFGLVTIGLIEIDFLTAEHKLRLPKTNYAYLTSFIFCAAFAVGWTPCVGAVLGGVLTLAVTEPAAAFPLMMAYSIGLGLPFLIVGAFTAQSTGIINKISPHLRWLQIVFGIILILLGILVFTNSLGAI